MKKRTLTKLHLVLATAAIGAAGCATSGASAKKCTPYALYFAVGCSDAPAMVAKKTPAEPPAATPSRPEPVVAKAAPRVKVEDEQITISEKVQFNYGSAQLAEESKSLLDEVAAVLEANPKITRVRVEGHTDSKGLASSNRKLSQKRAEAVRSYLIDKGISSERLEAKGYGAAKPVSDNASEDGRAANRRVEFHIVQNAVASN